VDPLSGEVSSSGPLSFERSPTSRALRVGQLIILEGLDYRGNRARRTVLSQGTAVTFHEAFERNVRGNSVERLVTANGKTREEMLAYDEKGRLRRIKGETEWILSRNGLGDVTKVEFGFGKTQLSVGAGGRVRSRHVSYRLNVKNWQITNVGDHSVIYDQRGNMIER